MKSPIPKNRPWWFPDTRGFAVIGFFGLTFYCLWQIQTNPSLLGVPSYMQFVSQLAGGGILLAAAWLFAAVKDRPATRGEDIKVEGENVTVEPK